MGVAEKLYKYMLIRGMNQQRLARAAMISDSEVSRILNGKSSPSLEYAFRLARALDISLDYLADDGVDDARVTNAPQASERDLEIQALANDLGHRQARRLLETANDLGYDIAMQRMLGVDIKPRVESAETRRNADANPARRGAG